jgi:hypothetical protein
MSTTDVNDRKCPVRQSHDSDGESGLEFEMATMESPEFTDLVDFGRVDRLLTFFTEASEFPEIVCKIPHCNDNSINSVTTASSQPERHHLHHTIISQIIPT